MDSLNSVGAVNLFSALSQNSVNLENLARQALSKGIDLYIEKNYEGAAREFKRSVGLSVNSSFSVDASNYLAITYLQLGDTENAVKTYKRSIQLNPDRDDVRITLGNLYFSKGRYEEAEAEYKEAARINPSAENYFSLGMACLNTENYSEAERIFNKVQRMEPKKPNGRYGLGLTYSKMGRHEDSIREFEQAIELDDDFYDAYAELGYAYADSGQMEKAMELVDFLEDKDSDLADTLSRYVYKVDPPKMMFAKISESTFLYSMTNNTLISSLDTYLLNADTSKTFTMTFQFDKEMDRESVEDRLNWNISRSTGSGIGQSYNFGLPIRSTEVELDPYPLNVYYDSERLTATVRFAIHQNSNSDATIDPCHIEFKFSGKDQYGIKMDTNYDQFTGFSGIA